MNPYTPKILSDNRVQFECGCTETTHPDNLKGDEDNIKLNLSALADFHEDYCSKFRNITHNYLASFPTADDEDSNLTDFEKPGT